MRPWKSIAAISVLAATGVFGFGVPDGGAGTPLVVKRFLVGHLEPGTGRFIALGGRGAEGVARDSVILIVLSAPLDSKKDGCGGATFPGSLNPRTVRIGIPTDPDHIVPAKGSFYVHTERAYDSGSGMYLPKRVYRNRILFDPLRRWDLGMRDDIELFRPDTTYSVTLPGVDKGALKTLVSSKGAPLALTFTTTFRTSDEEFSEIFCPDMDED
jgi:hypothetical protein